MFETVKLYFDPILHLWGKKTCHFHSNYQINKKQRRKVENSGGTLLWLYLRCFSLTSGDAQAFWRRFGATAFT